MFLKMSPQQIQLMKLLQIPAANLEERIKEELEANPALEESEDTEDEIPQITEETAPEAETGETESEIEAAEEEQIGRAHV